MFLISFTECAITWISQPSNPTRVLNGTLYFPLRWNFSLPSSETFQDVTFESHKDSTKVVLGKKKPSIILYVGDAKDKYSISESEPATLFLKEVTLESEMEYGIDIETINTGASTLQVYSSDKVTLEVLGKYLQTYSIHVCCTV